MPLSAGDMLAAQLVARGGEGAVLVAQSARPWASATFAGQVHRFTLRVAPERTAAFADGLAEADLPLRRHFVAEIVVEAGEGGAIVVEALTIEEG